MTATEEPSSTAREPGAGVRVTLVQLPVNGTDSPGDRLLMVKQQVAQAAEQGGAELVVLPEIWTTGAFDIDRGLPQAEPLAGPTTTGALRPRRRALHLAARWLVPGTQRRAHLQHLDPVRPERGARRALPKGAPVRIRYRGGCPADPGSELVIVPTPLGRTALATC